MKKTIIYRIFSEDADIENYKTTVKEKIFLFVPFEEKDEAKKLGAKWDKEEKKWFIYKDNNNVDLFSKWLVKRNYIINLELVKESFIHALYNAGLDTTSNEIIFDGKIHRIPTLDDKKGRLSGAYLCHLDKAPAGFIQNFKSGFKENWVYKKSENNTKKSPTLRQYKNNIDADLEKSYLESALKAQKELENAKYIKKIHPYLLKKGFKHNFNLKQDRRGNLLIPLSDIDGFCWSLQRIFANGDKVIGFFNKTKKFYSKKKGNFFILGANNLENVKKIFICEGFSTTASVFEAMNEVCIMAVDVYNIEEVIKQIHSKYPKIEIIIASDNDLNRINNIGLETALKIKDCFSNIKVVTPNFTAQEIKNNYSDFNDLMILKGLAEVKKQINVQLKNLSTKTN